MDKLFVCGNLGADARIGQKSANGSVPVSFPLLTNKQYTSKSGEPVTVTNRYSCTYWVSSENYLNYLGDLLKKGAGVTVMGEPSAAIYNAKDGRVVPYIAVKVAEVVILRKASDGGASQPKSNGVSANHTQGGSTNASVSSDTPPTPPTFNDSDDDLPF